MDFSIILTLSPPTKLIFPVRYVPALSFLIEVTVLLFDYFLYLLLRLKSKLTLEYL